MKEEIRIIYGKDVKRITTELISDFKLNEKIGSKDSKIGLKPNLVIAAKPESGATTHMEIIVAIIEYLHDYGFKDISIIEGSWVGDDTERAFRLNGYYDYKKRYGIGLYDLKKDHYRKLTLDGVTMEISERALSLDYMINLPVLKGHCQTGMTCAMKNLKGILSDRSKRLFHQLGLMKPIALLNALYHPSMTLVDSICGDLDFEEGGTPIETNRLLLGEDSVLLDAYAASLLGFSVDDVEYIKLGSEYGAGSMDLEKAKIIELNKPEFSEISKSDGYARRLKQYTDARSACSCCYANLIHALKRMEDDGSIRYLKGRKVAIGQGWKGLSPEVGVGACCSKAVHGVVKCPPSASDIMTLLSSL